MNIKKLTMKLNKEKYNPIDLILKMQLPLHKNFIFPNFVL